MFEEYIQDSYIFFETAKKADNAREARRYYRASVFYAVGAIEAYINYIADTFTKAQTFTSHEIAFINDKSLTFKPKKSELIERTEYHKLDEKLRVLINKFDPSFDFNETDWSWLMEFKEFRNRLVHPRQDEDETAITDYQQKVRRGLSGVIQVMNCINKGMYGKPLRKQILDLIPE